MPNKKNLANKKDYNRHCLFYEYHKAITTAAACRNTFEVYAEDIMDDIAPATLWNSGIVAGALKIIPIMDDH